MGLLSWQPVFPKFCLLRFSLLIWTTLSLHAFAFFLPNKFACSGYASVSNATILAVRPSTSRQVRVVHALLTDHCNSLLIHPDRAHIARKAIILVSALRVPKWLAELPHHAYTVITTDAASFIAPESNSAQSSWTLSYHLPTPSTQRRERRRGRAVSVEADPAMYVRYYDIDEWTQKWNTLSTLYAPNVSLRWIGRTYENRSLSVLTVGQTSTTNPRRLLLNAMQHAREIATTPIATYIVERLAKALALGVQPYASILTKVEVIVVPMVNPDGYAQVRAGESLWRKNVRPKLPGSSCVGVDLNRNWGFQFGEDNNGVVDPCEDNYSGPAPFSEPETQALRQLVLESEGILAHLDIHSYGQLVLGPWSYGTTPPADCARVNRIGLAYAQDVSATNQNVIYKYSVAYRNNLLYTASGTMADWMFARGVMSFTVEVRPSINENDDVFESFQLPKNEILPACRENFAGLQRLLVFVYNDTLPIVAEELNFPEPNTENGGNCSLPIPKSEENIDTQTAHTTPMYAVGIIAAACAVIAISIIAIFVTILVVKKNRK